jgi:integrase
VPLVPQLAPELKKLKLASAYSADDDLVFCTPDGRARNPSVVTDTVKRHLSAAGLDETHHLHDLRHTCGTRLAADGIPMREIQEAMSHADYKTTLIYATRPSKMRRSDSAGRSHPPIRLPI